MAAAICRTGATALSVKAFLAERGGEEATRPRDLVPSALMENNGGFWKLLQTVIAAVCRLQMQIKCACLKRDTEQCDGPGRWKSTHPRLEKEGSGQKC